MHTKNAGNAKFKITQERLVLCVYVHHAATIARSQFLQRNLILTQ